MVLVEDVTSQNNNTASNDQSGRPSNPSSPPPTSSGSTNNIINVLMERKIDIVLLLSRLATIFFTIFYALPISPGGSSTNVYYQKALMSSAVTSALRLRQRTPYFQFSRDFFFSLLREDSAHYLMYSLLFLSGSPMTIVLIPISCYALLHSCSFILNILTQYPRVTRLLSKVTEKHVTLLRFVALNEILLMPILLLSIFVARANFLLIFMYSRFLTLRYSSQRNPYTRQIFTELRITTEQLIHKPQCPQIVRRLCESVIGFVSRLAPAAR
ncbi:unnamed protein product [Didymodactylos carnosus]|uniref:Transmembrane protein 33 n=1 Tax=Didymodactylos carnosus TaxID=1234261 RepID=A0A813V9F1_9BILA|nr:unnamed protein product [Didymodactylos carnosus]CAF0872545.1 unnamed protein product [Didymodactylos carnosus]CAF3624347.1 unnamed protein product [Didymodactylos carnosus]CAF3657329.1 unnamed protein product [Didymodactylos carnosus]